MEKLKVIEKYSWGIDERTFKKTDLYCINCGKKNVYEEIGDDDYYMGASHYCNSCKNEFYVPFFYKNGQKQ